MKKVFAYGGVAASVVLIAFGIASIVVGFNGRDEVQNSLSREYIVGSPDMTPTAIRAEAQKAGLNVDKLDIPSMSVAGKEIDTGDEAKAFAGYMRIHTLRRPAATRTRRWAASRRSRVHRRSSSPLVAAQTTRRTLQSIRRLSSRSRTGPARSGSLRPPSRRR